MFISPNNFFNYTCNNTEQKLSFHFDLLTNTNFDDFYKIICRSKKVILKENLLHVNISFEFKVTSDQNISKVFGEILLGVAYGGLGPCRLPVLVGVSAHSVVPVEGPAHYLYAGVPLPPCAARLFQLPTVHPAGALGEVEPADQKKDVTIRHLF